MGDGLGPVSFRVGFRCRRRLPEWTLTFSCGLRLLSQAPDESPRLAQRADGSGPDGDDPMGSLGTAIIVLSVLVAISLGVSGAMAWFV